MARLVCRARREYSHEQTCAPMEYSEKNMRRNPSSICENPIAGRPRPRLCGGATALSGTESEKVIESADVRPL